MPRHPVKYEMRILIGPEGKEEWKATHPSRGEPYRYDTKDEARRMLAICYPDQLREERLSGTPFSKIVEVRDA